MSATTIHYPDVSVYDRNRGVRLQPGTVAVIAKATHARSLVDLAYAGWRQQAVQLGSVFGAYHWLNHGNLAAQARWCHDHVGAVPLMIDAEDVAGNTGYAGILTVADILGFASGYRSFGGTCNLVYLPHWYWERMGRPSLVPLRSIGLSLVSSNYRAYSDTGAGWAPYGGLDPVAWQYSDRTSYGGSYSDFNAFRGTIEQFRVLLGATAPALPATPGGVNMRDAVFLRKAADGDQPGTAGSIIVRMGAFGESMPTEPEFHRWQALLSAAGADPTPRNVPAEDWDLALRCRPLVVGPKAADEDAPADLATVLSELAALRTALGAAGDRLATADDEPNA